MPSLLEFSRRMTIRGGTVATRADRLTRTVALVADQTVVSGTPVDTGRARSNWIVGLGFAPDAIIEPYAPGEGQSTAGQNAQAAIDQGARVIAGYLPGQEIHITNNLPYIQELNDGSSAQAPANFVESAVALAVREVSRGRLVVD